MDTPLAATRRDLHRVATHILARRRHDVTQRVGLRATPGGIGTPAFGPPDATEVLRVGGALLLHEVGDEVRSHPLAGTTLAELAAFTGVDLDVPLSVGGETVAVGDREATLAIDPDLVAQLAGWYDLGAQALDQIVARTPLPATVQLWPEHFDVATTVATGPGEDDRANLGASPGDHHHDDPYLYVQPWTDARPGDRSFWNVSFGALAPRGSVQSVDDAVSFFEDGVQRLSR